MILEIRGSTPAFSEAEHEALELLALGYREGNFIIAGDPFVIEKLSKLKSLTGRSQSAYKHAHSRLPESLGLAMSLPRRFYIDLSPLAQKRISNETIQGRNVETRTLPLGEWRKISAAQKPRLLLESDTDCRVLKTLFSCTLRELNIRNIRLIFEESGLGGTNIGPEVKKACERSDRFFLAMIDSDRDWETQPLKGTAKTAMDSHDKNNPWGDVFLLPVRELENLAPINAAKACQHNSPLLYSIIEKSLQTKTCVLWKFVDWKEGVMLRYFKKMPQESLTYRNLTRHMSKLAIDAATRCSSTEKCKDKCHCALISGFGPHAATHFENSLSAAERSGKLKHLYTDDQWTTITYITQTSLSWFCARPPFSV